MADKKIPQHEFNRRVVWAIIGGGGYLAKRAYGWGGVLIYSWGFVIGGVGTMFMEDNNKQPLDNWLKRQVEEKKYLDIGPGAEKHLGVSREKLDAAVQLLVQQGYQVHIIPFTQNGTEHLTKLKIITVPNLITNQEEETNV